MDRTFAPPPPPAPDTKGAHPAPGRKRLDLLVRMAQQAGGAAVDRIGPRTDDGPAPLSFGQERLWLVHQLEPSSPAYAVQGAYRIPAVDAAAMERALGELVRRHEALRTTFAEIDGAPVQVVAPFTGFTLPVDDLSGMDAAEREAAAARRMEEEEARPFDLVAGPLFRPRLIRLGGEDILLFFMHHIISDAWSMGLLFRELGALYKTYENGEESLLPPVNLQYADYAVWQRRQLQGAALERQLGWWRERLAGAPARLELPTDHPRPAVRSYAGSSVETELPGELLERLRALAQAEGATLFMVLLGAFQLLLARYTGTEDVVVGSPVEGRSRREVEEIVGFFVNMLVMRTDLSGDPSFREVLRRVRETTLGAYEHQEMPFEKLVAELQPERSLSRSPLFQVVFAAETAARGGTEAAAPGQGVELEARTAQYDLVLSTAESARTLHASLNYSTELFDRPTMERMLGHLRRVLEQVAAEPDRRLSRLELAGAEERALVIEAWNRTARPFPREVCIHELFQARVRERPDAPALVWGDARLTYAELDARANRLAHHLRGLGVVPDCRVGVMLERGVEMIVSLLAILKAGGCYVPLDASYPAERLALMLADGGVRVVVSHGALAAVLAETDARIVCVDGAAEAIAAESAEAVWSGATAENLAYIVYTSGSTGKPKGVMVGHRHVVQLVRETDYVRLGPGDRVAQASNASFDALTFEAWGALLNGATLVGIPRDVLLSTAELGRTLREQGITTLYQTTALVNQLSREMPDIFAPLREVLFGGQAVDADSVRRLLKAGKPRRLLHMYGPTETTAWCSWEPIEDVAEGALTVSVGRPTGNQRIYLLDGALNPVPVGVPGEAYVGGDGVVRGYLERPALTAERFVPDPFAAEPGARMYRTGDRLRWMADGRLEFVGRVDDQVKIRGFRIEPGEVESVLSSHPDVRGARVIVREDAPGEKRLVAYVVGGAEPEAMRAHLRRTLPEYMVPAAFVTMDSLPLTPNGKLDVKALPAPDLAGAEDRYVAPRTPAEEVLVGVWAEVLGLERVGTADNFFELGGHSLLAARVVSRVHAAFGVQLPLRALFEAPTVGGMADAVEALRRAGVPAPAALVPVDRGGPLPMSFAQERLWFLDRLQPGSTTYNMEFPLRLGAAVNHAALERALGRDRPPARVAADHLRGGGRARGAGHPPLRRLRAPGGRPLRAGRGRARGGDAAPRRGRGGAPLRPGRGAGLSRDAAAAGGGGRAAAHPAPHRQRRVEHGRALPRAGGAVRNVRKRRGKRSCASGRAVRGLRRLAAGGAGGRGAGAAAGVVARAAGGRARAPGPADGSSAPAGPFLRRRQRRGRAAARAAGPAARAGPRRGRDAVHGAAGRLQPPPCPLRRDGRRRRRLAGGGAHAPRDGGADRLLRQHAGDADGPVGGSRLPRAAGPRARDHAGRVRAPGRAVRTAGGRAAAGALPQPLALLPGRLRGGYGGPGRGGGAGAGGSSWRRAPRSSTSPCRPSSPRTRCTPRSTTAPSCSSGPRWSGCWATCGACWSRCARTPTRPSPASTC